MSDPAFNLDKSIPFDIAGEDIVYNYDSAGDLVTVSDREDNITAFEYVDDGKHNLLSIDDPRPGTVKPIKNTYNIELSFITVR